jgi:hypothetical protein
VEERGDRYVRSRDAVLPHRRVPVRDHRLGAGGRALAAVRNGA